MITLIVILIYLISTLISYFYIMKAHSKNGRWYNIDSNFFDVLLIIFPIANTLNAIICLLDSPYYYNDSRKKTPKKLNKFFNINIMKPIKFKEQNTTFAENQPEYQQLPAFKNDSLQGEVISCWKLTL